MSKMHPTALMFNALSFGLLLAGLLIIFTLPDLVIAAWFGLIAGSIGFGITARMGFPFFRHPDWHVGTHNGSVR